MGDLGLKDLAGAVQEAAELREGRTTTISPGRLLAAERRDQGNAGRLDSHRAFIKTPLHHVLTTIPERKRTNKSRLFNSVRC